MTLKERGSGVEAESFMHRLRLRGENEAIVLRTRCKGKHVTLILDPVHESQKIVSEIS